MGTKQEQVAELLVIVNDAERTPAERLEALNGANEVRKEMKIGWAKLGMDNADALKEQLEAAVMAANQTDAGQTDEPFDEGEGPARADAERLKIVRGFMSAKSHTSFDDLADLTGYDADEIKAMLEGEEDVEFSEEGDAAILGVLIEGDGGTSSVEAEAPKGKAEKPKKPVDPNRGRTMKLTNELLMDVSLSYQDIVDKIRSEVAGSKTTTRSVASVAAELRKKGVDVPIRRKEKKTEAVSEAPAAASTDEPSGQTDEVSNEPEGGVKDPLE